MFALLSSAAAVLGYVEDAVKYGPALLTSIHSAVTAVEATDKSGPDKLTAVLNSVGSFAIAVLPAEATTIGAFMAEIEALVGDMVALYNQFGVFTHRAPVASTSGAGESAETILEN